MPPSEYGWILTDDERAVSDLGAELRVEDGFLLIGDERGFDLAVPLGIVLSVVQPQSTTERRLAALEARLAAL